MPLISLEDDEDQRWVPTHVNVTVQRARALRVKGKQSSRYVYTVIQLGKEKYVTGLAEKAAEPEWNEECSLELQPGLLECVGAHPPGASNLTLTVMLRVLIGIDMFLGQTVVPLDKVFQHGTCPKNQWLKLHSKPGRKEKERGELQLTVQFTRNNMTASMYDLTIKDKPRSAFGKLKDRVSGKKRGDVESSSAILPGRYAALSSSTSQSMQETGAVEELKQEECGDERKSKMKDFFLKGKLRKNSDTQSCSSLASDSSMASSSGDPFVRIELCSTPIYSRKVIEPFQADSDVGVKGFTAPKVMTHKRAHSDEASKITAAPRPCSAVENLKGQNTELSQSTLCINGSHIYSEPIYTKGSGSLPIKRTLLEKCSPLSRSLQNLTRRSEDSQRRCSIDKSQKESEVESEVFIVQAQRATTSDGKPVHAAGPLVMDNVIPEAADKGKKLRKTLFSSGRSDSLPAKPEQGQEGRLRGWFGSSETQNKPRLRVPSKVESSPDTSSSLPLCFPSSPPRSLPLVSGHISHSDVGIHHNPFIHPSPPPPSISPSNPFLTHLQRNPFFEELIAEEALKSPPAISAYPNSSFGHYSSFPAGPAIPSPARVETPNRMAFIKRERPRGVTRQRSLPALMPGTTERGAVNFDHAMQANATQPLSHSRGEWDEFEALASSRLKSPLRTPTRPPSAPIVSSIAHNQPVESLTGKPRSGTLDCHSEEIPNLPSLLPRRSLRTPMPPREKYSDSWLDRAQELAVQKEACVLLETNLASLRHVREANARISCLGKESILSLEQNTKVSPSLNTEQVQTKDRNKNILDNGKDKVLTSLERGLSPNRIMINGSKLVESCSMLGPAENGTQKNPTYVYERIQENSQGSGSGHTVTNTPLCPSDCDTTVSESLCSDFQMPLNPDSFCELVPVFDKQNKNIPTNNRDSNNNTNDTSQFAYIDCDSSPSDVIQSNFGIVNKDRNKTTQCQNASRNSEVLINKMPTEVDMFSPKKTLDPVVHKDMLPQGILVTSGVSNNNLCDAPCDSLDSVKSQPKECMRDVKENVSEHKEGCVIPQMTSLPNKNEGNMTAPLKPEATVDNEGLHGLWEVEGCPINDECKTETDELKAETKTFVSESNKIEESCLTFADGLSFKDLHARVAPKALTSPAKTEVRSARIRTRSSSNSPKTEPNTGSCKTNSNINSTEPKLDLLHDSAPPFPILPSDTLSHSKVIPNLNLSLLVHPPTIKPDLEGTLAVSSYCTSTAQLQASAQHTLSPEEAEPDSSLPIPEECSPHPVKPLTNMAAAGEKKSVLEKFRFSIHPGRSTQQSTTEPEKSKVCMSEAQAHYQSLSNMELIDLLLQQEIEIERQRADSELQATLLEKREADLKKLKAQVRDLEDYIDKLLVQIMEQTPTLLQVRARPK